MAQKIFAGRTADPTLSGALIEVKVDQVVLSRDPSRALAEAETAGYKSAQKKTSIEVAVAYDTLCVTGNGATSRFDAPQALAHGLFVGRPGVGFPGPVHLERFASPARLALTDDPRLAQVGGIGMLSLVASASQLGEALAKGSVLLRPPRTVQVLLSGRMRPFVCARDLGLELERRKLGDVVRRVEAERGGPVVLEFSGPSVRLLSVSERAVLAQVAPRVGAAAALFVSDERTEVFLRDQRRSKAHRALVPDAGAPSEDVVTVDLSAVDPLLVDEAGVVRPVRDLAKKAVSQVILGGDSGTTLRDLFAAAALLKSKRVPAGLDLLLAVPSRQMLEVLAGAGALADLIAAGARVIEPDARLDGSSIYPPPRGGLSLRTADPEPILAGETAPIVASAETLAYAVATGEVGDPRAFKRPVRVALPRVLPTDDVLIVRERQAKEIAPQNHEGPSVVAAAPAPWRAAMSLALLEAAPFLSGAATSNGPSALVCTTLAEVMRVASRADDVSSHVRAVIAPYVPSAVASLLSGAGIVALAIDAAALKHVKGQKTFQLPAPSALDGAASVAFGSTKVEMTWLALDRERDWVTQSRRAR